MPSRRKVNCQTPARPRPLPGAKPSAKRASLDGRPAAGGGAVVDERVAGLEAADVVARDWRGRRRGRRGVAGDRRAGGRQVLAAELDQVAVVDAEDDAGAFDRAGRRGRRRSRRTRREPRLAGAAGVEHERRRSRRRGRRRSSATWRAGESPRASRDCASVRRRRGCCRRPGSRRGRRLRRSRPARCACRSSAATARSGDAAKAYQASATSDAAKAARPSLSEQSGS